jgi:cytochrome c biogenesis protein CcmG/thiol:disulfide interchange protein DsbE
VSDAVPNPDAARWRRRALLLAPLAAALAAGGGFYAMLRGLTSGTYDPHGVPSALLGRPVPDFTLPPLPASGTEPFTSADLRAPSRPVLINFFASWCQPCIIEHPQLMALKRDGVPVFGIAYKDKPADAAEFLRRRGNPYARLAQDEPGRVAIEWGLYGVPETYLVDKGGLIRWRWAGPITEDTMAAELRPLLQRHA